MSDPRMAYIAGILDGEGSFSLACGGSYRYKGKRRRPTYRPLISVTNTHFGLLEWMREVLGVGRLYTRERQAENHSRCLIWTAQGHKQVLEIIPRVIEFLIVKKEQAVLMERFARRRQRLRTRPFTQEDFDFVREMRLLNARDPAKGSPITALPS